METPTPQIDYTAVLADLKRKRDEMDKAIVGIEAMLGLIPGAASTSSAATADSPFTEIKSDSFFGMSIAAATAKYLGLMKRVQTTPEICAALLKGGLPNQSENFGNTVGSVLARNAEGESPIFVKVKRGTWGLRAWYPNWCPKKNGENETGNPEGDPA